MELNELMLIANWEMLEASTESGVISKEARATVVELPSTTALDSATEIELEPVVAEFEFVCEPTPELEVLTDWETELETDCPFGVTNV